MSVHTGKEKKKKDVMRILSLCILRVSLQRWSKIVFKKEVIKT